MSRSQAAPVSHPSSVESAARFRYVMLSLRSEGLLLALVVLLALGLRVYRLQDVPPGLTHDEAANGQSAVDVLQGDHSIYFTVANGREPLYPYSMAPVVALLGATEDAVRVTSVLWGLALVVVTWAWVRAAFDPLTALLAASTLAVGYWPLMISRLGLRAVTLPVLFTASVLVYWPGVARQRESGNRRLRAVPWQRGIGAGLLLGLSFYTYMASRAMPVVFVIFAVCLMFLYRPRAWDVGLMTLVVLIVAVGVTVPLVGYLQAHPQAETRIGQLIEPLRQAGNGDWEPLGQNVLAALKMFSVSGAGDPHWIYNISGRPLLDPLSGLLFYSGLLITLWRWRDPAHLFSLIWLVVGMTPVFVTGANSSVVRAVAALPVVFVMQGVALRAFIHWMNQRSFKRPVLIVSGLALLAIAAITVHVYFDLWPNEPDVRVAYHTTLVEIAQELDARDDGGTAIVSSIYPGFYHDPLSFDLVSHRDDLYTRWVDGRFALLFPDVDEAYVVFTALAPLDAALVPFFAPHSRLLERVTLYADDLNDWFEVYKWQPRVAAGQLSLDLPVNFGDVVDFLGHQLRTPVVLAGETVEVLTFWRVLNVPPDAVDHELVLFTHVLDNAEQIVGQQDRLDVPAWNWSPGDRFVQLHRFTLEAGLPPGFYPLEIGVYTRTEGYPRLAVVDGQPPAAGADVISLPPVEVRAP